MSYFALLTVFIIVHATCVQLQKSSSFCLKRTWKLWEEVVEDIKKPSSVFS